MKINFEELKLQKVDNNIILEILENLYKSIKTTKNNMILNELCKVNRTLSNEYNIKLSSKPLSNSDIFIVSQDGSIILTPTNITKIENDVVYISNKNMKMLDYVYVTYKY